MTMKRYQQSKVNCEKTSFQFVWDTVLSSTEIIDSMGRAIGRIQAHCTMSPYAFETAEAPTLVERSDARPSIEVLILAVNLDITAHPDPAQNSFYPEIFDGTPLIELMPNGEWKVDTRIQDYIETVPYVGPGTSLKCGSNHPPSAKAIPSRYLVESVAYSCGPEGRNPTELFYFGLGNFVSWGSFNRTHKVDVQHAAYPALEFEIYRALQAILAQ